MLNILRVSCVSLATLLELIIIVSCNFNLDAIVTVGTEEMAPHVMVIFSRWVCVLLKKKEYNLQIKVTLAAQSTLMQS